MHLKKMTIFTPKKQTNYQTVLILQNVIMKA